MGVTIAPTLATWTLSLSPYAATAFYLAWGLAFMAATWVTLKAMQRRDSLRWALPFTAGYQQITLWALNLSLYRSSYARSLWGRDLVLTAALLAAVAILNNNPNHVTD